MRRGLKRKGKTFISWSRVLAGIRLFSYHVELTQWASCQIRKIAGCACAGNAGNVSPRCRFQRKPLVSDPGMHHGTCVTHVPWCMSGSLTCGDGENVPGIPGACATAILRIWQEAHGIYLPAVVMSTWYFGIYTIYNISQEICTRFCCALLCCGYAFVHNEFTYLSIFIRVALLALGQSLDCHSASEVSLMDMGKSVNV